MRTYKKKMIKHVKAINVKLSDEQHKTLMEIRAISGKNISTLIRENLTFLTHYYNSVKKNNITTNN